MWWERYIPKSYLTKSSICALQCVFGDTGITYFYTVLNRKKNNLEISLKGKTSNDIEILNLVKQSNNPFTLVIDGKGIIIKKIMFGENDSLEVRDLVKLHFSTIQEDNFYVQFYKNSNRTGHLVICRRELVNEVLQKFGATKQECVNVFLGPFVCNSLAALIEKYNYVTTPIYRLDLVNGEIDAVNFLSDSNIESFTMDHLTIDSSDLVSFAAGFSYLTRQTNYKSEDADINQLSEKHHSKIKIRVLLVTFIFILLFISVLNSVLFFQKFELNSSLDAELQLYESKNSQITKLLENYQKKKSLIEQTGILVNKTVSVFADKIASTLPGEIVLKELYFNPEKEHIEKDSLLNFYNDQLVIKGNCNKSLILNEWINVLKSQQFVKSVNLENFIFNSESHLPNFVLKVEIE